MSFQIFVTMEKKQKKLIFLKMKDPISFFWKMGPSRFELETSALSRRRHNHLDYGPYILFAYSYLKVLPGSFFTSVENCSPQTSQERHVPSYPKP